MESTVAALVIVLGVINVLRMASYMILGDIYDQIFNLKRNIKRKSRYNPFISIVIAAYNEEKVIQNCLLSVYASTYTNFEVLVVNDGSNDKTSIVVHDFIKKNHIGNLRLVEQTNSGKANALNNAIINFSRGRLIMVLDADSRLDQNALQRSLVYFRDRKVAALAANVRIIKQKNLLGIIQYIEYLMGYRLKKAFTVLNNEYIIGGIGSMFRRGILKTVNYYSTDNMTEDIDLTMKIAARGNKSRKLIYASDVLCFTQAVQSINDLFRQRFRWKYGRFQTLWKHKKMFFNTNSNYTKLLTFLQLPFVLYSEFTFLLDPLFMLYLVYIEVHYHDLTTFLTMLLFLASYSFITILADEYLLLKEKLPYLLMAPFAYFFFLIISCVEYVTLIKCIRKSGEVLSAEQNATCQWVHVARS